MMVLLLLGESGAGKTTIAQKLCHDYSNFNIVKSYTTRFRRNIEDKDHIFVHKRNLLYKMFNEKFVASTIINKKLYCSFPNQFKDDIINIYIVDDKGVLDTINYFGLDSVLIVRLKRNNINIGGQRLNRDLNQIIPDNCTRINVVQNDTDIDNACNEIVKLCRDKWPCL